MEAMKKARPRPRQQRQSDGMHQESGRPAFFGRGRRRRYAVPGTAHWDVQSRTQGNVCAAATLLAGQHNTWSETQWRRILECVRPALSAAPTRMESRLVLVVMDDHESFYSYIFRLTDLQQGSARDRLRGTRVADLHVAGAGRRDIRGRHRRSRPLGRDRGLRHHGHSVPAGTDVGLGA